MLAALAPYQRALRRRPHLICYAMKANSSLAVLQTFAQAGCGFDIVSGGELERVLAAGGDPSQGGVLRRRQDARRDAAGARRPACAASTSRAKPSSTCCRRWPSRAGRTAPRQPARQPRRRRRHAPLHLHRPEGQQVRHRARAARLPPIAAPPRCPGMRGGRHRLPHRLADHRARPVPRRARPRARPGRGRRGATASRIEHLDLGGGLGITYTDEQPPRADELVARAARAHRRARPRRSARSCSSRAARWSATPACC